MIIYIIENSVSSKKNLSSTIPAMDREINKNMATCQDF